MSLLKVTDLVVSYGGIEALKGISFEVDEGQIVTLIGANGAGKSTTLRSISGLVQPKDGRIYFEGRDITDYNTQKIVETGIAMVPEGRRVFANLTVLENLRIGAYLRKDKEVIEQDINYVYDLFPRLKERSWQLAGTLSGGEQQMLAVGRAVMTRPKLIMMDEPSLGLAPLVVKDIFKMPCTPATTPTSWRPAGSRPAAPATNSLPVKRSRKPTWAKRIKNNRLQTRFSRSFTERCGGGAPTSKISPFPLRSISNICPLNERGRG